VELLPRRRPLQLQHGRAGLQALSAPRAADLIGCHYKAIPLGGMRFRFLGSFWFWVRL
jgi:hypothetical protein